jgi:hypothetical protein
MTMAAKKRSSSKSKGRSKSKGNRVEEIVDLQKRAIDRWSKYTINTARLAAAGKMSPKEWINEYTDLTRDVLEDVGKLVRLVLPSVTR